MDLLRFLCISQIYFVNTDFIFLVTAQMSYWLITYTTKTTQKVVLTFRKNGFIKGKNQFKIIGKD